MQTNEGDIAYTDGVTFNFRSLEWIIIDIEYVKNRYQIFFSKVTLSRRNDPNDTYLDHLLHHRKADKRTMSSNHEDEEDDEIDEDQLADYCTMLDKLGNFPVRI